MHEVLFLSCFFLHGPMFNDSVPQRFADILKKQSMTYFIVFDSDFYLNNKFSPLILCHIPDSLLVSLEITSFFVSQEHRHVQIIHLEVGPFLVNRFLLNFLRFSVFCMS